MQPRLIGAAIVVLLLAAVAALTTRAFTKDHSSIPDAVEGDMATAAKEFTGPVEVVVSPKGVVAPVVGLEGTGWRVQTPCGNQVVVQNAKPLAPVDVVLDPGHGGEDSGAVGPNGLTEAHLNLAVAREAQAALGRAKLSAALTRTADYNMNLETRAKVVMGLHPKVFVSVHHNSTGVVRSDRPGTEIYYQVASPDSRRLAGLLQEDVQGSLGTLGGPWVAAARAGAKYMLASDGDDYLGMLRRTHGVPSALAEMAYVTHAPEAELLARPENQRLEGEALARAIQRFLTTPDPGSGFTDPQPAPLSEGGRLICGDPAF